VKPAAGRLIVDEDDAPAAAPAAVISHGFWRRKLGTDPSAIGATVILNGTLAATIVGVTPPDFNAGNGVLPDFTLPLAFEPQLARGLTAPGNWGVGIVGRLKPGVTLEQVRGSVQGLFRELPWQRNPTRLKSTCLYWDVMSAGRGFTADVVFQHLSPGRTARRLALLTVLGGVFLILLLIVSLNIANLLIARAGARRYEIGLRLAMGASRRRLIRQLLTESAALALFGGALGSLFAYAGKDLLRLALEQDVRAVTDLRIDPRVLAFAALVSYFTGILFGILPALRSTRMDVNETVKQGSRTIRGSRSSIGRALLVTQVAMSVVLLVGASLLLRTLGKLPSGDIGFDTDNLLVFRLNVAALEGDRVRYQTVIDTIRALPGVRAVTASSVPFLSNSGEFTGGRFEPPFERGQAVAAGDVRLHRVEANFFETLGIPVLRGRAFDQTDSPGSPPVAVITESLARRIPGDPIGWRFRQAARIKSFRPSRLSAWSGTSGQVKSEPVWTERFFRRRLSSKRCCLRLKSARPRPRCWWCPLFVKPCGGSTLT
jgi:predicted permease